MQLRILPLAVAVLVLGTGCGYDSSSQQYSYAPSERSYEYEEVYEDEDEDDYREPYSGTTTVEACSSNSGNCYDLDADIEDGNVEVIYFPNGGYLHLDGAEIDGDGDASGSSYSQGEGYNGDEWEIHCDDCE